MVEVDDIWKVLTTFSEEAIEAAQRKCDELGFDKSRGKVPLAESLVNLRNMRAVLQDAIDKRKLIQLPISIQNEIHRELTEISGALSGLTGGVDQVVNVSDSIERLYTLLWQSRLEDLSDKTAVYKDTENRLKSLEIQAQSIVRELEASLEQRDQLIALVTQMNDAHDKISVNATQVEQYTTEAGKAKSSIESVRSAVEPLLSSIETIRTKASDLLTATETIKKQSEIRDGEIDTHKKAVVNLRATTEELVETLNNSIGESLVIRNEMVDRIELVYKRAESLLPGATSAGLAHAFRQRKEAIAKSKGKWLIGFVASICSLVFFVVWIVYGYQSTQTNGAWWQHVLQRIPLTFPFIWAGWFFGRNFGHMIRLEEVYAFKETVCQSFEGFRTQMSEVSPDKGLPSLCEQAISILSASPLVVFDRKTSDETPAHSLFSWLSFKKPTIPEA